ncbi:hypothetical protein FZEAL_6393 [Fusarium zealandicum]|uniref:RING-type domain-containing protein n=1 Tax=Fusarium zealandicum TaxID=1053134 RepID=A0A8H4UHV8_9HYPO|nr:hypothetical protein FZEAL_6393 [Fusarium zealandicum]
MSNTLSPECFWPVIKAHIYNNNSANPAPLTPIHPRCPICHDGLSITTFPEPWDAEGPLSRHCNLLVCGHVVCQKCVNHLARNSSGGDRPGTLRACPMCRTSLRCSQCSQPATCAIVPSHGQAMDKPMPGTAPEGIPYKPLCPACEARGDFLDDINNKLWPQDAVDIEVGFVPFFYHLVEKLEARGRPVTEEAIRSVFSRILGDEFPLLMRKREELLCVRRRELAAQHSWFPRPRQTPADMYVRQSLTLGDIRQNVVPVPGGRPSGAQMFVRQRRQVSAVFPSSTPATGVVPAEGMDVHQVVQRPVDDTAGGDEWDTLRMSREEMQSAPHVLSHPTNWSSREGYLSSLSSLPPRS